MEGAVWSFYIWGGISRCLFEAVILAEEYYKGWRELFGVLIFEERSGDAYIGGENWRKLFRALILAERFGGSCLELLYRWGDIIRGGEVCSELLYWRRDLEGAVWSFYNWGGISRCLFGALILAERYYKEWRELFRALIIGEGCGGSCLELL